MAIIKSHQEKSGCGRRLGELPKILEYPFNIFATAEASNFKFGMQFGLSKAHHKITPRGTSGRGPWLRELPKIFWFAFNISATTEGSDFSIGRQVGFAKVHHKIPPKRKSGR